MKSVEEIQQGLQFIRPLDETKHYSTNLDRYKPIFNQNAALTEQNKQKFKNELEELKMKREKEEKTLKKIEKINYLQEKVDINKVLKSKRENQF